ncbi:MAG: methylated-DNA--[protein]-cysteine S-methyltransferase [Microbacterium sp.]|uniref:methylated-DNA--[protein]-cysteine S-methyltransferase n=1 Tax=Microbacterium sp. TaxID=51671 RepID=UPI003A8B9EC4
MTLLRFGTAATPVGTAVIAVTERGLVSLDIDDSPPEHVIAPLARQLDAVVARDDSTVAPVARQLDEYFAGERTAFDIALDLSPTRGFPLAALRAILDIPYGETAAYGEVAVLAGAPGAARAVGTACARTPISIVIPVHRVVRSDGSIGRYGRDPDAKRYLIDLEHRVAPGGILMRSEHRRSTRSP